MGPQHIRQLWGCPGAVSIPGEKAGTHRVGCPRGPRSSAEGCPRQRALGGLGWPGMGWDASSQLSRLVLMGSSANAQGPPRQASSLILPNPLKRKEEIKSEKQRLWGGRSPREGGDAAVLSAGAAAEGAAASSAAPAAAQAGSCFQTPVSAAQCIIHKTQVKQPLAPLLPSHRCAGRGSCGSGCGIRAGCSAGLEEAAVGWQEPTPWKAQSK